MNHVCSSYKNSIRILEDKVGFNREITAILWCHTSGSILSQIRRFFSFALDHVLDMEILISLCSLIYYNWYIRQEEIQPRCRKNRYLWVFYREKTITLICFLSHSRKFYISFFFFKNNFSCFVSGLKRSKGHQSRFIRNLFILINMLLQFFYSVCKGFSLLYFNDYLRPKKIIIFYIDVIKSSWETSVSFLRKIQNKSF